MLDPPANSLCAPPGPSLAPARPRARAWTRFGRLDAACALVFCLRRWLGRCVWIALLIGGWLIGGWLIPGSVMAQEVDDAPTQFIDLDAMLDGGRTSPPVDPELLEQRFDNVDSLPNTQRPWEWQLVPEGLIYHSYLAGIKEPRLGTQWVQEQHEDWLWDSTLGGRVGVVRYGTVGPAMVQGFEVDVEAAALLRQDPDNDLDVVSVDFRAGLPLTFSFGRYQTKLAYYHLSSHLGDEFMLKNPGVTRINYVRDVLVWGHSYYLTDELRAYFEAGWAFNTDGGAKPWEFQFGMEHAPSGPTGSQGAPFLAVNGHLRQELNYSGSLTAEAGWAWRGQVGGPLMRVGVVYYNGLSPQFEFYRQFEQQIGLGLWYDF